MPDCRACSCANVVNDIGKAFGWWQPLMHGTWNQRSLEKIRRHIRGFEDNELRRYLVRAGAVAFEDPVNGELRGLRERNIENFQ